MVGNFAKIFMGGAIGARMGTSGLVGQIQTFVVMGKEALIPIILTQLILPAIVSYLVFIFIKKKKFY